MANTESEYRNVARKPPTKGDPPEKAALALARLKSAVVTLTPMPGARGGEPGLGVAVAGGLVIAAGADNDGPQQSHGPYQTGPYHAGRDLHYPRALTCVFSSMPVSAMVGLSPQEQEWVKSFARRGGVGLSRERHPWWMADEYAAGDDWDAAQRGAPCFLLGGGEWHSATMHAMCVNTHKFEVRLSGGRAISAPDGAVVADREGRLVGVAKGRTFLPGALIALAAASLPAYLVRPCTAGCNLADWADKPDGPTAELLATSLVTRSGAADQLRAFISSAAELAARGEPRLADRAAFLDRCKELGVPQSLMAAAVEQLGEIGVFPGVKQPGDPPTPRQ